MSEKQLAGSDARRKREALGMTLEDFYPPYIGITPGAGSRYENGLRRLKYEHVLEVKKILVGIFTLQERHPEVPIDVHDYRAIRKAIRKIAREKPPEEIEQEWGAKFILQFCEHSHIEPAEFCACVKISSKVADAAVVSRVTQRWIRAFAGALAVVLDNRPFDDYAVKFADRPSALESLANAAFDSLLAEVGRKQMRSYMNAMMLTAEVESAPHDLDEN